MLLKKLKEKSPSMVNPQNQYILGEGSLDNGYFDNQI
jgi:hypothetical protein